MNNDLCRARNHDFRAFRHPPVGLRRLMAWACLGACTSAAWALPLDPGVTREIDFVSYRSMCTGLLPLGGDNMSCTLTHGAGMAASFADYYGSPSGGSAQLYANGVDMKLSATTTRFTAPDADLDAVQFDQFTITGPTPTVNVGVKVTIDGSSVQSAPGYVLTSYTFISGQRSPTPNASADSLGDRIRNDSTRDVLAFARTATLGGGILEPVTHRVETASFTAAVGAPFERGFEFVLSTLDTSLSFSARIEYSLPDGYTLTSARGLSVNAPVPESARWALMLVGLAGLAGLRLQRQPARPA